MHNPRSSKVWPKRALEIYWLYNNNGVHDIHFFLSGEYRREQPTYEEGLAQVVSEAGITEWDEAEQKEIAKSFSLLPGIEMRKQH